jgi:flavin reductase (DIM6/NTAB) family NADH-FMN oxidoreductase RutF
MDADAFKQIMASFPSGVAVVTVSDVDGSPRGLTCSAVCSVSLEPALLLICIGKTSNTLPALQARGSFVVNFLAEHADQVARTCASKDPDKFSGFNWRASERAHGAPILVDHVVAHAECLTHSVVEAGDHLIVVAEVVDGATCSARDPMIHTGGRIKQLAKPEVCAA